MTDTRCPAQKEQPVRFPVRESREASDPPPPTVPPRVLVQSSLVLGVRTPESREIQERMIRPDRLWGWWSIAQ